MFIYICMSFFCKLIFPVLMYVAGTSHSLPTESLQPQQLLCRCAAGHSCCSNSSLVLWQFVISATASGTHYTYVNYHVQAHMHTHTQSMLAGPCFLTSSSVFVVVRVNTMQGD